MEPFRCPTCIGLLPDAPVRRCPACRQRLRRRRHRVLGEDTRIGASSLPIDRWMLDRLDAEGVTRGRALPPVAWHGRFTSTRPEAPVVPDAPMPEPEPEPEAEALTPPPPPPTVAPAPPAPRPQPVHDELDPEVRALIDELYDQARAEVSGNDVAFFAPVAEPPVVAPPVVEPPVVEPPAAPQPEPDPARPPSRPPAAPNASSVERPARARTGWVAAIQMDESRQHPRG